MAGNTISYSIFDIRVSSYHLVPLFQGLSGDDINDSVRPEKEIILGLCRWTSHSKWRKVLRLGILNGPM